MVWGRAGIVDDSGYGRGGLYGFGPMVQAWSFASFHNPVWGDAWFKAYCRAFVYHKEPPNTVLVIIHIYIYRPQSPPHFVATCLFKAWHGLA